MRLDLENLPPAALRAIADRTHRAHVHRMNGVAQMLTGWASLGGAGGDDPDARIRAMTDEMRALQAVVIRLWNEGHGLSAEGALQGDLPQRMLIAALREGTPTETERPMPVGGGVALAAALWTEAVAGDAMEVRSRWQAPEGQLQLVIEASPLREAPADLMAALRGWIDEVPTPHGEAPTLRRLNLHLLEATPTTESAPQQAPPPAAP